MAYNKTPKAGAYSPIAQMITIKELLAMTEYVRNFKQKYTAKKSLVKKKK